MSIYDLNAKTPQGEILKMSDYEGKTLLIVNTATQCGYTPQLADLEKLNQKYKDKGLVIIGFPCNQFLNQEPESNDRIEATCLLNYGVTFQLTEKIKVNGSDAHPIFKHLKSELGGTFGSMIKWNFTKFLIKPDGKAFKRYAPSTKIKKIEKDILDLMGI